MSDKIWYFANKRPTRAGWYATVRLDMANVSTPRYFDDTAPVNANWFIARSNGGGDGIHEDEQGNPLVVNMSFDMWTELPTLK